jgi:GntR family transcriptional regulator, phosphonate transport system regulatory protein
MTVIGMERGSGVSLWRQIEETLVGEIARGAYSGELRFPTEAELSRRFGVNRHTVRRAVAELTRRGLLRVEQGRGMFVAEHAIDYALGPRTRFSENLLRQGRQPSHSILRLLRMPGPPEALRALALEPRSAVVFLETIGAADGRPISSSTTWFPAARLPGLEASLRRTASITAALAELGVTDYRRRSTRVIAMLPSEEERARLLLAPGRPVLVAERLDEDREGVPIGYGVTSFAADRVQLVLES